MTDKPNSFQKINIRPEVKREVDILAAAKQIHVYDFVAEMLEAWKKANGQSVAVTVVGVSELPHPADAEPVPVIYVEEGEK